MARRRSGPPPRPRELPALRPVELLVLAALADNDQHGYGIVRTIEQRTEGKVALVPGNLYRVLHRLIDRRFIEVSEQKPTSDEDPRRLYYRITTIGREEARREVERVESLAALARQQLGAGREPAGSREGA